MSDVVSIIKRLEIIRDNWTTLGASKSIHFLDDIRINSGVGICKNACLMNMPYAIYIDMIKSWPNVSKGYDNMADYHFPVGGAGEYYGMTLTNEKVCRFVPNNLYTNPKRLEFVEHCIKYLTDNKEIINERIELMGY